MCIEHKSATLSLLFFDIGWLENILFCVTDYGHVTCRCFLRFGVKHFDVDRIFTAKQASHCTVVGVFLISQENVEFPALKDLLVQWHGHQPRCKRWCRIKQESQSKRRREIAQNGAC